MDMLKQLDEVVGAAFADGDEFVTIFNNAILIVGVEEHTLKTKFIGGETVSGRYDTCNL